jgi:hypothetical protein
MKESGTITKLDQNVIVRPHAVRTPNMETQFKTPSRNVIKPKTKGIENRNNKRDIGGVISFLLKLKKTIVKRDENKAIINDIILSIPGIEKNIKSEVKIISIMNNIIRKVDILLIYLNLASIFWASLLDYLSFSLYFLALSS